MMNASTAAAVDRVMKWLAVVAGLAIMQSGPQTELSCGKLAPMDTAKLELAAQRYREAETALDAARADLQAEAVVFLRQTDERGAQAAIARITGWTDEHLRRLMKSAEEQAT